MIQFMFLLQDIITSPMKKAYCSAIRQNVPKRTITIIDDICDRIINFFLECLSTTLPAMKANIALNATDVPMI